ncbi:MAG: MFS transporter [Thermomicrobiales bacterium]
MIGLSAPAVARRLGPLRAVFLVRSSIVPFYLVLIVAPGYGLAILAHLVRQTSISMAWPIDSTFIGELLPRRARLSVFGLRSAAWNLNWAVASLLGGAIIVRYGYDWTFVSIGVFTFLSAVIFISYFGRHPKVRSGEIGAVPGRPVTVNSFIRRWPRRGNGVSSGEDVPAGEVADARKEPGAASAP